MKRVNKKGAALAGLAAAAAVGGTFAYYNYTATLDNPLSTGNYDSQLVEEYTPPAGDVKPGAKLDKTVIAENTGDYPILVRVSMKETWTKKGASEAYKTIESKSGLFDNGSYDEESGIFTAEQVNESGAVDKTGDTDGLAPDGDEGDGTVVHKILSESTNWVRILDDQVKHDGYWYWNGVLEKGEKTDALMENLLIASNIDLGKYVTEEFYAVVKENVDINAAPEDANAVPENTDWTRVVLDGVEDENGDGVVDIRDLMENGTITVADGYKLLRKSESSLEKDSEGNPIAAGYSDSNYTLTITSEFVQATRDAVSAEWGISDIANELSGVVEDAENPGTLVNKTTVD